MMDAAPPAQSAKRKLADLDRCVALKAEFDALKRQLAAVRLGTWVTWSYDHQRAVAGGMASDILGLDELQLQISTRNFLANMIEGKIKTVAMALQDLGFDTGDGPAQAGHAGSGEPMTEAA